MELDQLKGREFTVRSAEPSAKHAKDDVVTFHGPADKVEIKCKRYPDGTYNNGTISDGPPEEATYTITVTKIGEHYKIDFMPGPQVGSEDIGGSWTADDMPPGPDNG